MDLGVTIFLTDQSIDPVELARLAGHEVAHQEERERCPT